MKKTTLIILSIIFAAAMLIGCTPQQETTDPDANGTQQIKAVIQDVTDNQLFVHITEGLDGIEDIYLNFRDDTKVNVSEDIPLEPGNVVVAIIGNEIMESDPPQAVLYEIVGTEPGDSTGDPVDSTGTQPAPDNYVTGKVITINADDTYTIEILNANLYSGEMTLTIPVDVQADDMPIVEGYLIGVYIAEDNGAYTAEKLVFSDPDKIIALDPRERISGIIGEFPAAIYNEGDTAISAVVGDVIAIGLVEPNDCPWTLELPDGLTPTGDGTDADAGILPDDTEDVMASRYFGIRADTAGEYTLTFTRPVVNGGDDVTHTVTLTVETHQ